MAVLFPIQNQQNFYNPNAQNFLLPQGMINTLQGGNVHNNLPSAPQNGGVFSLQNYQPPTLPSAMNNQLVQNPELQDGDGKQNYSANPLFSVPQGNYLMQLSATTSEQSATPQAPTNSNTATTPTAAPETKTVADAIADLQNPHYQKETNSEEKITNKTYPKRDNVPASLLPKLNSQPYLDADSMQTLNDIYAAKSIYQNYDAVQKKAAETLAQKDLSDEDRTKWQNLYDGSGQVKENMANLGQMARQNLLQFGVNSEDYGLGSGNTLDESTQAINFLQQRDMRHFLNLPSGKELEKQRQKEYMDSGVGRSWARFLARQDRDEINRDLSGQYLNAMQTYGLNADGSMNNYGFALASKWAKDDPTSANLYLNGYATPNAQYQAQNTLLNTAMNNESAERRTAASLEEDWNKFLGNLGLGYKTLEQRGEEFKANQDLQSKRLSFEQSKYLADSQLKQIELWQKSPQGKMDAASYFAANLFKDDPAEQQKYIASYLNAHWSEDTKGEEKRNEIINRTQDILSSLLNGKTEEYKAKVESLKADFADTDKGYLGKIDPTDYNCLGKILEYYDALSEGNLSTYDVFDQTNQMLCRMTGQKYIHNKHDDPQWYKDMSPEDRERLTDITMKERGWKKPTTTTPYTSTATDWRKEYQRLFPYGMGTVFPAAYVMPQATIPQGWYGYYGY